MGTMTVQRQPVLLYDGECGLCNGVVLFMLRHDREGRLHFASLQSAPGQDYLKSQGLPTSDFGSLVFVPDWAHQARGAFLLRTDGALAAVAELDGPWRALAGLRFAPHGLRDAAYRLISKTRYALFGQYRPGPLPDPSWEKRFLAR
jgi:predicted DCC family thiol-disulfide oxidoreductase YuxK